MHEPANINLQIIETLYCEALVLADDVRECFTVPDHARAPDDNEDLARIALSCEGLRTTTRVMHAIAWLLNQRSCLMGELSKSQLRQHGRLSRTSKDPDQDNLALLNPNARELIAEINQFYARLQRLDTVMQQTAPNSASTFDALHSRINQLAC